MAGLQKVLKLFGRMNVGGVMWVWDYAQNEAVKESEMPKGSERWKQSEAARWTTLRTAMQCQASGCPGCNVCEPGKDQSESPKGTRDSDQ
jgi:hypothetical protein